MKHKRKNVRYERIHIFVITLTIFKLLGKFDVCIQSWQVDVIFSKKEKSILFIFPMEQTRTHIFPYRKYIYLYFWKFTRAELAVGSLREFPRMIRDHHKGDAHMKRIDGFVCYALECGFPLTKKRWMILNVDTKLLGYLPTWKSRERRA